MWLSYLNKWSNAYLFSSIYDQKYYESDLIQKESIAQLSSGQGHTTILFIISFQENESHVEVQHIPRLRIVFQKCSLKVIYIYCIAGNKEKSTLVLQSSQKVPFKYLLCTKFSYHNKREREIPHNRGPLHRGASYTLYTLRGGTTYFHNFYIH